MLSFFKFWPNKWTLNVRARVAIRPVYSKPVLPSRKSLEIIINIKINIKKIKKNKKNNVLVFFHKKRGMSAN